MNLSSLAQTLMKKAVAVAGDGAREVSLELVSDTIYDPETGDFTTTNIIAPLGHALFGMISEAENVKHRLAVTTHKAVIPYTNWTESGQRYPEANDRVQIDGEVWEIERVAEDSMRASIILFMAKP